VLFHAKGDAAGRTRKPLRFETSNVGQLRVKQLCDASSTKSQGNKSTQQPQDLLCITMSDSELSDAAAIPSDAILEKTLRDIVRKAEVDPITVKRVRTAAEERLGLDPGFFKGHDEWEEKSKDIIEAAFVCFNAYITYLHDLY
jgi:hypothetical protein